MASFKELLERVNRSIDRNGRTLKDLNAQLAVVRPRGGMLVKRLEANAKRVAEVLNGLERERAELAELVAKSPELPLDQSKKR